MCTEQELSNNAKLYTGHWAGEVDNIKDTFSLSSRRSMARNRPNHSNMTVLLGRSKNVPQEIQRGDYTRLCGSLRHLWK